MDDARHIQLQVDGMQLALELLIKMNHGESVEQCMARLPMNPVDDRTPFHEALVALSHKRQRFQNHEAWFFQGISDFVNDYATRLLRLAAKELVSNTCDAINKSTRMLEIMHERKYSFYECQLRNQLVFCSIQDPNLPQFEQGFRSINDIRDYMIRCFDYLKTLLP